MIESFLDLEIYTLSLELAKDVHYLLKTFPPSEKFLIVDQMNRASRGIPSLIAEGWAKRRQVKEFQKYLRDAIGESNEMMNHIQQAALFGYISTEKAKELVKRYDFLAGKICSLKNNWKNFEKE